MFAAARLASRAAFLQQHHLHPSRIATGLMRPSGAIGKVQIASRAPLHLRPAYPYSFSHRLLQPQHVHRLAYTPPPPASLIDLGLKVTVLGGAVCLLLLPSQPAARQQEGRSLERVAGMAREMAEEMQKEWVSTAHLRAAQWMAATNMDEGAYMILLHELFSQAMASRFEQLEGRLTGDREGLRALGEMRQRWQQTQTRLLGLHGRLRDLARAGCSQQLVLSMLATSSLDPTAAGRVGTCVSAALELLHSEVMPAIQDAAEVEAWVHLMLTGEGDAAAAITDL